jgi:prepilin-type N-terminal cleavage/methylation domain-containing protein
VRALSRTSSSGREAFTLVEMLISSAIVAIILGAIGMTVLRGKENFRQGVTAAVLEARGRRVLERIVTELQGAETASMTPNPTPPLLGSSSLRFRTSAGYNGTAKLWNPWTRIQFVPDPRDPVNGVDDDGDGMIDEGRVVLVRDDGGPNQVQITLANNVSRLLEGEKANAADDNGNGLVDEAGLTFSMDADQTLTIRLTLGARDPRGRTMLRTVQTSVRTRN